MKIFGYEIKKELRQIDDFNSPNIKRRSPTALYPDQNYPYSPYEHNTNINIIPFDGEKTPYELGTPLDTYPDYYSLRIRAWESFLKTDIVQNAIRKYCLWVIGAGLKLQSEPSEKILKGLTNPVKLKEFVDSVESQFRLYSELRESVYSNEHCLHEEAAEALKNCIIAGDLLCVNRFVDNRCTIETIDGRHVQTPIGGALYEQAEKRGNKIINGVEIDKKGGHYAYYVSVGFGEFEKIPAYGENSNRRQAWLMYGNKNRKSDIRGMSLLAQVMETVAKMDRYKEAAIGSAEENAKIPYTFEHDMFSSGENPMTQSLMASFGKGLGVSPETIQQQTDGIATKVAQTTGKTAYNLPIGTKLMRKLYEGDVNFKDFFGINLEVVYTTLSIPPEVAQDKFGGAYSGSRAALKSWEHKIKVDRIKILQRQFYQPYYDFWLDIAVLSSKVSAPGYLAAMESMDYMVLGAYRSCRFIGSLVPHIDPVKEVTAMRGKLGKALENVPLDTIEKVMEELNSGDFENVINKINYEREIITDYLNIEPSAPGGSAVEGT